MSETTRVPLPPKDADILTTACDYCVVACGYKVYRWPVGDEGGPDADDNALGRDFPVAGLGGNWVSPNMHSVVSHEGRDHNVLVVPDGDADVVNVGGDHSIRGGCLAQKCYSPTKPTKDRLQSPLLRVNGKLVPISWDDAVEITARVGQHVLEQHGSHAYGIKMFSYAYFENTYALTRFAFTSIKTPSFSWHDSPAKAPSVPGLSDVGFHTFTTSYEDLKIADVLFISGTDPYETKTILFNEWILKGVREHGAKLIMVNPRKTTGVAFAEKSGGLHLQLVPGTDTLLQLGIARVILEEGWEDIDWIRKYTGNKWDSDSGFGQGTRNTDWQWRTTWGKFQTSGFDDYKSWLLGAKESELAFVSETTGVSEAKIRRAAEIMAKPIDGVRPKTSLVLEKGNYWSNNYTNTTSLACLGLLCGSGNRPGRVVSRLGGHQRGGLSGGNYPVTMSPEKQAGRRRKPLDLDRWVEAGKCRFAYAIGTTWTAGMTGSQGFEKRFRELVSEHEIQVEQANVEHAVERLIARADAGGMVLVNQDIYLRKPIGTAYADLILPASGWGENDFTRCNGERRLRLYQKFYDAPGESRPDWWIVARIAKAMGFEGYDWKTSADVFEEGARFGRGGRLNYHPLVWLAKRQGKRGHELLREYGTTGIQCPIKYEDGELVGTKRIHDSTLKLPVTGPEGPTVHKKWMTQFNTHSGKAQFLKSPWFGMFDDFFDFMRPKRDDEVWVINGRLNELWQSGYDDLRRPYIVQRWPANFLEIHPDDAERLGIESGDEVRVYSDRIPVQTGGFLARTFDESLFSGLMRDGHIKLVSGDVKAVAIVMESVRPGVTYMNFLHLDNPANSLVARVADPITNNYRYKLGVGIVERIGESPYKHDLTQMSFKPRTLA